MVCGIPNRALNKGILLVLRFLATPSTRRCLNSLKASLNLGYLDDITLGGTERGGYTNRRPVVTVTVNSF